MRRCKEIRNNDKITINTHLTIYNDVCSLGSIDFALGQLQSYPQARLHKMGNGPAG